MDSKFPPNIINKKILDLWHLRDQEILSDFNSEILKVLPQFESILKLNGQYIHVYDTSTMDFAYISDSTEVVLGHSINEWKAKKAAFVMEIYCSGDALVSEKIHDHLRMHALQQLSDTRSYFRYSNTFRLRHKKGHYVWLLNHLIFLAFTSDDKPYMVLSYATDISHIKNNDDIVYYISRYNPIGKCYETIDSHIYRNDGAELLSDKEREVLCYLSDGLSNKEIAIRMNVSEHTISDHRKNMLRKTNVDNTCQLLSFSLNNAVL